MSETYLQLCTPVFWHSKHKKTFNITPTTGWPDTAEIMAGMNIHMRNLRSTKVLLTRFLLPKVLRIKRNICKDIKGFSHVLYDTSNVYTTNTHHLLSECEYGCEHKILWSKVDDTKKQRVKDQQCGLVSVKQHITKRVRLICREKRKHTLYAGTYSMCTVHSRSGPGGHYHCKRCFFQ